MNTQFIEMIPKEINIKENGNSDRSDSVTAGLIVIWIRPNEYNDVVTGEINGIQLIGGEVYNKFPTNTPQELIKNQLVKTKAIGRSVIKVEVITAQTPGLLHKVFSTLFGTAVGLISIANPFASALVGLAKGEIQSEIKKKKIVSLGQGFVEFDANTVIDELNIELISKSALTAVIGIDEHGIPISDPDDQIIELLGANENNGNVVITLNTIST